MMASTHVAIGVVVYGGACAFAGAPIEPAALGAAALGALLPDVDTPNSRAGFCVYPLALYLEKKFGHRTITHSFVGTTIFAALCLPLLFWEHLRPLYFAILAGYGSHLLADAATKSGVPLAWPNRRAWVFPGNDQFRIKTGSAAEIGVLLMFLIVGMLMIPVHKLGVRRLIHMATNSLNGAVRDTEDWSDSRVAAHVVGYDVLNQKIVDGTWPVIGRRDDGALVIERDDEAAGYWLLRETGEGLHRIAPRTVRIEKLGPSLSETRSVNVSNLTLAALARVLDKVEAAPAVTPTAAPEPSETDEEAKAKIAEEATLHRVLVSGEGECWPFPADPGFAPTEVPQFGLKAVKFAQSHISFDFAQPRHILAAGKRVAIRSATLSVKVPIGAKLPDLQFPTIRREVVAGAMLRHADLRARVGQLLQKGDALNRTFGQTIEAKPTPADEEKQRAAESARRELEALAIEERALKQEAGATWLLLAPSYDERRHSLQSAADWKPAAPVESPAPAPQKAPFDCIIENIEWEPPTQPAQKGELPEHAARLTLVKVTR